MIATNSMIAHVRVFRGAIGQHFAVLLFTVDETKHANASLGNKGV